MLKDAVVMQPHASPAEEVGTPGAACLRIRSMPGEVGRDDSAWGRWRTASDDEPRCGARSGRGPRRAPAPRWSPVARAGPARATGRRRRGRSARRRRRTSARRRDGSLSRVARFTAPLVSQRRPVPESRGTPIPGRRVSRDVHPPRDRHHRRRRPPAGHRWWSARTRSRIPGPFSRCCRVPPPQELVSWVRHREGLVGWGRAAFVRGVGSRPLRPSADQWWRDIVAHAVVRDEVRPTGFWPSRFRVAALRGRLGRRRHRRPERWWSAAAAAAPG